MSKSYFAVPTVLISRTTEDQVLLFLSGRFVLLRLTIEQYVCLWLLLMPLGATERQV